MSNGKVFICALNESSPEPRTEIFLSRHSVDTRKRVARKDARRFVKKVRERGNDTSFEVPRSRDAGPP